MEDRLRKIKKYVDFKPVFNTITRNRRTNIRPSTLPGSQILVGTLIILSTFGVLPQLASGKLTIDKECGEIVCKPHNYCSQVDHSCRPCQLTCDPALGNYDKAVCEKDCQDYLHDLWYMRKPDNESGQDELYVDLYYRMEEDLRLLKILIGVVIILSTVVMLALFAIMVYFKRIRNRLHMQGLSASSGGTPYLKKSKRRIEDLPVIYSNNKVLSLPFPEGNGPPSHISSSINNNMSRGSSPDLVSRTVTMTSCPYSSTKTQGMKGTKDLKGSVISMSGTGMSQQEKQSKFRKEPSESTLPEYHAYDNPGLVPSPVHNVHM